MKTSIRRSTGERYFGVEITPDGKLIVAERTDGRSLPAARFPAGASGSQALREHIERESAHPHVCIKACGAAALGLATALIPVKGVEVTLVTAQAVHGTISANPEERAEQLAKLAELLF
jgi:transposase